MTSNDDNQQVCSACGGELKRTGLDTAVCLYCGKEQKVAYTTPWTQNNSGSSISTDGKRPLAEDTVASNNNNYGLSFDVGKSVGAGIVLSIFFPGTGLIYASIGKAHDTGYITKTNPVQLVIGIVGLLATYGLIFAGVKLVGPVSLVMILLWVALIVYAALAISKYNRKYAEWQKETLFK